MKQLYANKDLFKKKRKKGKKKRNKKQNPYSWWAFLEPSGGKAVGSGTIVMKENETMPGMPASGALVTTQTGLKCPTENPVAGASED